MLDVHELVTEANQETRDQFKGGIESRVKQYLLENGHEALAEYIEWGEAEGYHERATCRRRDVWFDLGALSRPPLLMPEFTWREFRMVWNEVDGVGTTQFYNINPDPNVDMKVLCGLLNSRLTWMNSELLGRQAGGQGMTRARMKVYEAKQLPLPDPRRMTDAERDRIRDAVDALMERENELGEDASVEATEAERDTLDEAVLATMRTDVDVSDLKQAAKNLVAVRERGSGEQTEVLVERTEEREVLDLAGVSEARESATLDEF